jgi:hypothetical protein
MLCNVNWSKIYSCRPFYGYTYHTENLKQTSDINLGYVIQCIWRLMMILFSWWLCFDRLVHQCFRGFDQSVSVTKSRPNVRTNWGELLCYDRFISLWKVVDKTITIFQMLVGFAVIPCHGWGRWSPASQSEGLGSCPGHSMWDLWWTKWRWDRFFSKFLSFPVIIISPGLLIPVSFRGWTIGLLVAAFQRHRLTLSTWTVTKN